jgi:hypothetical protein
MRDNHAIRLRLIAGCWQVSQSLQRDTNHAMVVPDHTDTIEVEEGGMSTINSRDFDWRLHVGILGHGNVPHLWDRERQSWAPISPEERERRLKWVNEAYPPTLVLLPGEAKQLP